MAFPVAAIISGESSARAFASKEIIPRNQQLIGFEIDSLFQWHSGALPLIVTSSADDAGAARS
jgi:hypothetical protein